MIEAAGRRPDRRILNIGRAAVALVSLAFVVLLARVAQLQVHPADRLVEQMTPRVAARIEPPPRGELQDRLGRPLAVTRFGARVLVDPTILDRRTLDQTIVKLAQASGLDPDLIGTTIQHALDRNDAVARELAEPASSIVPAAFTPADPDTPTDDDSESATAKPRTLLRYLPIGPIIPDAKAAAVRDLKLRGVSIERRPIREYPGGLAPASLVGLVGFEHVGLLGAEFTMNEELLGAKGRILYAHDRAGRPLWIDPGQVNPATPGLDVRLSIDLEVQRIAYQELDRGIHDSDAAGGRCIVLDPVTGEVLAIVDLLRELPNLAAYPWEPEAKPGTKADPRAASRPPPRQRYQVYKPDERRKKNPALARNRCVEDVYEPGSTFKPFVWSTITELGLARLDEVFDTEGGKWHTSYGRYVEDVAKRASMTWREVLINSSNIGMIKGAERLSFQQLHDAVVRFGFGSRTGIELPGEATGLVTPLKRWSKYSQTSYAHGNEVAVTPVQMVRAFSAFARTGELAGTIPQIHLRAVAPSGDGIDDAEFQKGVVYRVLPSAIADTTRDTMRQVAENVEAKMKDTPPGGWRYEMFGKSGTAEIPLGKAPKGFRRPRWASGYYDDQYNCSFIAGAPSEHPRIVVIVVIDDPGPDVIAHKRHYGSMSAGPVVRRIVERTLTYLGTPPSPSRAE